MRRRTFIHGLALTAACALDRPLKREMDYVPEDLGDGWPVGEPQDVGVDPDALEAAYARFFSEDELVLSRGFLVFRRGILVAEGYARSPLDRDRLQHVKSATKSVTSILAGQALERGVLPGLDATLGALLAEAREVEAAKQAITIADLLTMRSGLDWENSSETGTLMVDEPANSVAFTLARPLIRATGVETNYADGDPHLVGAAISRRAASSLEALARAWLFEPLGIRELKWEHHQDGIDYAAYGLWLRPRDMARIGELYRRRGAWNGVELVSPAWIDESTAPSVDIEGHPYGYYWWSRPDFGGYTARGHGGQYIYVVPDAELVLVHTAHPYSNPPDRNGFSWEIEDRLIRPILAGLLD